MTRTTCEELVNRIVDYVDGELPAEEAQMVARHLSECPRRRQTATDLKRSLGLARIIWQDNLADTTAVHDVGATPRGCPPKPGRHGAGPPNAIHRVWEPGLPLRRTTKLPRRTSFYVSAVAASVLLAAGLREQANRFIELKGTVVNAPGEKKWLTEALETARRSLSSWQEMLEERTQEEPKIPAKVVIYPVQWANEPSPN